MTFSSIIRSNSTAAILNQGVRTAVLGLWFLALARFFPPAQFGVYVTIFALAKIIGTVAGLGLDRIIVKHLAEDLAATRPVLAQAWKIKGATSLFSYGFMLAATAWMFPANATNLTLAALIGAPLLGQPLDILDFYFQAKGRIWLSFWGRGVPLLVVFGIKIICLLQNCSLTFIAGLEVVELAMVALGMGFAYLTIPALLGSRQVSVPTSSSLLSEGLPLLAGSIAVVIYMKADILMLGKMVGPYQTGLFSAAAQLSELWAFIPMAIATVLFPKIIEWGKRDPALLRKNYELALQASFLMALIVAVVLTLLARPLVITLYGPSYENAAAILQIHAWSGLFVFFGIAQSGFDIFQRLTWLATWRMAFAALLNILLNYFWIPFYGGKGAAWATLIAYACSAFLFNFIHPSTRSVFWMQIRSILFLNVLDLKKALLGSKQ